MRRTFKTVAGAYPPEIAGLAAAARDFLLSLLPKLHEELDPKAPYVFYSYGPGYKGLVCTLFLSKSAVKIGLVNGSDLSDPHRLLEGAGKVHKHIVLKAPADLKKPGLKKLVKDCEALWKRSQSGSKS
jgi:hypothetical protein